MLYNSYDFVETLYNSLSDDGVIIFQLGEAPEYSSPAAQLTSASMRENFIHLLVEIGFESLHIYEDGNCGFSAPWTFLIAFKADGGNHAWYMNPAEVDVEIHDRILRTKSGNHALNYFDGATMNSYRTPHKVFESVFCRAEPKPDSCITDRFRESVPVSDLEVKMSSVGDGSGRGVFTKVDIKQGTAIAKDVSVQTVHIPGSSLDLIWWHVTKSEDIKHLFGYIDGYGWEVHTHVSVLFLYSTWQKARLMYKYLTLFVSIDQKGAKEYFVEPSIMTFTNHGCNGTFNALDWKAYENWVEGHKGAIVSEQNATADKFEEYREEVYDMFADRHIKNVALGYNVATRDIKAGEELLDNYVYYVSSRDEWFSESKELKDICNGVDVGYITKSEIGSKHRASSRKN